MFSRFKTTNSSATSEVFVQTRSFSKKTGAGGRSSSSGVVCTVFGATGFVGRYVVNRFGRIGSQVIVPFRGDDIDYRHLKVMGDLGQIVPIKYSPRIVESIERAVSSSNVVINLIGSTRPTFNYSLDDTNRKIARIIARVSKEQGVKKLIHMSDLRADLNSPSEYARVKAQADIEVLELFPSATLIRSAPVFGPEDKLTNAYGVLQRYWKRSVTLICENHGLAPIYAGDLAAVLEKVAQCEEKTYEGQIVECVGPASYTHKELSDKIAELLLLEGKYKERRIPAKVAETFLRFAGRSPRFRPMWSEEEIKMRQGRDALPSGNHLLERCKENLENCALLWLRRFREPAFLGTIAGNSAARIDTMLSEEHDAEIHRVFIHEPNPTIKRVGKGN